MKTLKIITFCTLLISTFVCCHKNKDSDYFNGDIRYFNDDNKIVKNVKSKSVPLNGLNYGMIAIYDSLLICWNPKLPNHFFNIFNVDTGEEIGAFCKRGRGPQEMVAVSCIFQFFKKENDIMTLLYATNESKLFFWNISKSLEKGVTVWDTIVSLTNKRTDEYRSYNFLFFQPEETLFAYVQSNFLREEEATTPFYEKRKIFTDESLRDYPIYKKKSVQNAIKSPISLFYSWDVFKPDGSKIVQAMRNLSQINILNIHTGEVVGYRMQNCPNFSYLETNMQSMKVYYNSIQTDDNYMYATYWGREPWDTSIYAQIPFFNIVHVFDWDGKLLYELITDRVFFRIWLDQVRNRLYSYNHDTDEVYYIDLNELSL